LAISAVFWEAATRLVVVFGAADGEDAYADTPLLSLIQNKALKIR
jgi:hypothetical protein